MQLHELSCLHSDKSTTASITASAFAAIDVLVQHYLHSTGLLPNIAFDYATTGVLPGSTIRTNNHAVLTDATASARASECASALEQLRITDYDIRQPQRQPLQSQPCHLNSTTLHHLEELAVTFRSILGASIRHTPPFGPACIILLPCLAFSNDVNKLYYPSMHSYDIPRSPTLVLSTSPATVLSGRLSWMMSPALLELQYLKCTISTQLSYDHRHQLCTSIRISLLVLQL